MFRRMVPNSPLVSALSRVPGVDRALPFLDIDGPVNVVRVAWDRLSRLPYGNVVFSRAVGRAAPYTGTIRAVVVDLAPGRAEVVLRDRPELRNHLKCVHAITLANLAEMTGNVALAYGLPDDARFIVAGMELTYVKKARGTITATSEFTPVVASELQHVDIPVEMKNQAGDVVTRAVLHTQVGPKRAR
jgi:acyl-coenzyme A thioesterase PaaI-like protein